MKKSITVKMTNAQLYGSWQSDEIDQSVIDIETLKEGLIQIESIDVLVQEICRPHEPERIDISEQAILLQPARNSFIATTVTSITLPEKFAGIARMGQPLAVGMHVTVDRWLRTHRTTYSMNQGFSGVGPWVYPVACTLSFSRPNTAR